MTGIIEKIKQYLKSDDRVFAEGICFHKLVWIFIVGCIFGVYYEQILNLVTHYLEDGSIFWESRKGVIYGPFSPIYGGGAVLLIYLLARKTRPGFLTFLYGGLLGGGFEYLIGFLQEWAIGTTSWDYSNQFLNINGRTTIPYMMVWGILAYVLVEFIYPVISNWIESIPYQLGIVLTRIMVVFLALDMFISWTALFRQTLRRAGFEPYTVIGEIYDQVYPDEVLEKHFPNMVAKR